MNASETVNIFHSLAMFLRWRNLSTSEKYCKNKLCSYAVNSVFQLITIIIRMSFIGHVCLHIRGICYSDRVALLCWRLGHVYIDKLVGCFVVFLNAILLQVTSSLTFFSGILRVTGNKIATNHVIGMGQEKVSVGVGGTGNCNDIHIVTCKYLSELFSHYSHSCLLRSKNSGYLIIPRISKSTAGGRSFSCLAPKLWNNLPNTV